MPPSHDATIHELTQIISSLLQANSICITLAGSNLQSVFLKGQCTSFWNSGHQHHKEFQSLQQTHVQRFVEDDFCLLHFSLVSYASASPFPPLCQWKIPLLQWCYWTNKKCGSLPHHQNSKESWSGHPLYL